MGVQISSRTTSCLLHVRLGHTSPKAPYILSCNVPYHGVVMQLPAYYVVVVAALCVISAGCQLANNMDVI
jgi:hypothetical protein